MKASEAREKSEKISRAQMKARYSQQRQLYEEKTALARRDFGAISREIRKKIKTAVNGGAFSILHQIQDRPGCDDPNGNIYLEVLQNLIEDKYLRDGYTVNKFDICGNGTIYEHPTRYWANLEISW